MSKRSLLHPESNDIILSFNVFFFLFFFFDVLFCCCFKKFGSNFHLDPVYSVRAHDKILRIFFYVNIEIGVKKDIWIFLKDQFGMHTVFSFS